MTRGAGDISFVASYLPGLVGTGALGKGAHAEGETVFLDSLPSQAKRNAVTVQKWDKIVRWDHETKQRVTIDVLVDRKGRVHVSKEAFGSMLAELGWKQISA